MICLTHVLLLGVFSPSVLTSFDCTRIRSSDSDAMLIALNALIVRLYKLKHQINTFLHIKIWMRNL